MDKYQLSNKAELDIDHLYTDGILKYGLRQADQYYDGLIEQFQFLAGNLNIGYNSCELAPNLQRFSYGRHIIFFTNTDTGILIVRVLGKEMDFKRHL
jgi:toxin ParE1/3/4